MSGFLSAEEIKEAVAKGTIRIAYYAAKDAEGKVIKLPGKRYVKLPAEPATDQPLDVLVRKYFLESLEPDSLTFHLGPYVALEQPRRGELVAYMTERNGQSVYKVADAGRLVLQPGEFVLAGTNEYIEVDASTGGSLYANVRNTDIGLAHISTLIDPGWQGKLQIGIANAGALPKPLEFLDAICIVRFHRLATAAPEELVKRLLARRPHADEDWWTVESEAGRSYFPMRRDGGQSLEEAEKVKQRQRWRDRLSKLARYAGIGSLGAVLLFLAVKLETIKDASEYSERLFKVESRLAELDKIQETFHVIDSGSHRLNFADRDSLEFYVPVKPPQDRPPIVMVNIGGLDSSAYSIQIRYSYNDASRTQVNAARISIKAAAEAPPAEDLTVYWLAARPSPTAQASR